MKYLIDTHTHTIASGHAYNTIDEMTKKAAELGLQNLAITDHAPAMPGSSHKLYFSNLKVVPRRKFDVNRLIGCEVNIVDYDGKLDLSPGCLNRWILLLQVCICLALRQGQ